MLNINRSKTQDKILDKTEKLSDEAKDTINKASNSVKSTANKANQSILRATNNTENQAESLIDGLRDLINQHSSPSAPNSMKKKFVEKATQLRSTVGHELSTAYDISKERAAEQVKNHPVGTLALVAGTSLLIGFALGNKQSSR